LLLRHENRDSVRETRPRSSVGQTESQNPCENQQVFERGGHVVDTTSSPNGVNCPRMAEMDSELTAVIAAWAMLPKAVRAGVVAMVKAATLDGG
jgi:hypothetical protein